MYNNVLSEKFVDGIWLGSDLNTDANTATPRREGYTAGRINRRPLSERWSRSALDAIKGCPKEPMPGQGREIPSFKRPDLRGGERGRHTKSDICMFAGMAWASLAGHLRVMDIGTSSSRRRSPSSTVASAAKR